MDDLQLIKKRLADTPLSELHELSAKTGISFGALFKIKYGETRNPRFDTVKALRDYYLGTPA